MPGLLTNMVHVEATIDGVTTNAFIGTGAAANVCTCQAAYTICLNGQAVFREREGTTTVRHETFCEGYNEDLAT